MLSSPTRGADDVPMHRRPRKLPSPIPSSYINCVREIDTWRHKPSVLMLMAARLPNELILKIAEHVVALSQPELHLQTRPRLAQTARALVGMGVGAHTERLRSIFIQAILCTSTISANVAFERINGERVAVLPTWTARSSLPHPIQHFSCTLSMHIPLDPPHYTPIQSRLKYPIEIVRATTSMSSLKAQLPESLKTFLITIRLVTDYNPAGYLPLGFRTIDAECRKGFSGTTTYREVITSFLEAVEETFVRPQVLFRVEYWAVGSRGAWNKTAAKRYWQLEHQREMADILDEADTYASA